MRAFISKHVSREADGRYASALQAYQRGDLDKAVTQAAEAALAQPDNPRLTHVGFIRTAQDAPPVVILKLAITKNPEDLEARYQLCAVKMTQDNFEEAMELLLEIVRHDNTFRHQAGRDGLLAVFSLLGEDDERTQRHRALLNQVLH